MNKFKEKSALQLNNEHLSMEVVKLHSLCNECLTRNSANVVLPQNQNQFDSSLSRAQFQAELRRLDCEIDKLKQELTVKKMEVRNYNV